MTGSREGREAGSAVEAERGRAGGRVSVRSGGGEQVIRSGGAGWRMCVFLEGRRLVGGAGGRGVCMWERIWGGEEREGGMVWMWYGFEG